MEALAVGALALTLIMAGGVALLPGDEQELAAQATEHHIHIVEFDMDPIELTIEAGDTVTWHNHDTASHSATDDDGAWDTGVLASDESASITFDDVDSYTYHCTVHPGSMSGYELTVVEPNQEPTASIQSPADGAEVSGIVDIEGTAMDPDGDVQRVEVRIDDGPWDTARGTDSWLFKWNSTRTPDGTHTVEARAFDGDKFGPADAIELVSDNPTPDLVVQDIQVEHDPPLDVELTAILANQGQGTSPATTVLFEYITGDGERRFIGELDIGQLLPGATTVQGGQWQTLGKAGNFTLVVTIDPGNVVDEASESNNVREEHTCVPISNEAVCLIPGLDPLAG